MPNVPNSLSETVLPIVRRFVQIKKAWSDDWEYVPYLWPTRCSHVCGPAMDRADFSYQFGNIQRETATSFSVYTPLDLRGYFIRIQILRVGDSEPQDFWTGVVVDEEAQIDAADTLTGDQTIRALGLAYLLDRQPIRGSYCLAESNQASNVTGSTDTVKIGKTLTFNMPRRHGFAPVADRSAQKASQFLGNRSTLRGNAGYFLHSRQGERWNNRDVCEYLLHYHGPTDGPLFVLAGADTSLSQVETISDLEGQTVWGALNQLIDRRLGYGFYVRVVSDSVAFIQIDTVTDTRLTFGTRTLQSNANQVTFSVPTDYPYTHLLDPVPFRTVATNEYDKIEVWGELVKVCFTADVQADDTTSMAAGWTLATESAYLNGAGGDDYEANDDVRSESQYENVYRRLVMPPDWKFVDHNDVNVAIKCDDNGWPDPITTAGHVNVDKRFLSHLPFLEGYDYSTFPPTDNNPTGTIPEYRKLMVIVNDRALGFTPFMHTKTDKWHILDRVSQTIHDGMRDIHARPLDDTLGVMLAAHPNHYMAGLSFDGAKASWTRPEFYFYDTKATVFMESDERFKIVIDNPSAQEGSSGDTVFKTGRTKIIPVDGAELWYAVEGTIFDVQDGEPVPIDNSSIIMRHDIDRLQAYAAFAKAWYGKPRQAVELTVKQIGIYVPLMAMLVGIDTLYGREPVRTVVTGRFTDFREGVTTIQTGWGNADFAPVER